MKQVELERKARIATEATAKLAEPRSNRRLIFTSYTIIFLGFIFSAVILFWLLYPYKVADIKVPIQVLNKNKQIRHGEYIELKVILDKYLNIAPSDASIFLACDDGNLISFALIPGRVRPVGHFEYKLSDYTLPRDVATGSTCTFNFKIVYRVNPIRHVIKDWPSEEFKVKE